MKLPMRLDIAFHKGSPDKPAVIFIHGLGMDKRIWAFPEDARIVGGSFPLSLLLSEKPEPVDYGLCKRKPKVKHNKFSAGAAKGGWNTSFDDLRVLGHTVITWSQKRPAGAIAAAVSELKEIIGAHREYTGRGIVLIGHSRGGLIARKYMECEYKSVKGLITLATPHYGSSMARWADYMSPLAAMLSSLIKDSDKKTISSVIKRILNFIRGKALKELLPDSEFFRSLSGFDYGKIHALSFGGTNPNLLSVYRWRLKKLSELGKVKWLLEPEIIFSVPEIFEKIIPEKFYPEELKYGHGDGLIRAESSVLPGGAEHHNFNVNHAAILFDTRVREKVIEAMGKIQRLSVKM